MDHFIEANDAVVNCILDAVKDPTLNNELEALHSKHADAPVEGDKLEEAKGERD